MTEPEKSLPITSGAGGERVEQRRVSKPEEGVIIAPPDYEPERASEQHERWNELRRERVQSRSTSRRTR